MLTAELVRSQLFFREFVVNAERKRHRAEAANAKLRGKLTLANEELALVRAQAPSRRPGAGREAGARQEVRAEKA